MDDKYFQKDNIQLKRFIKTDISVYHILLIKIKKNNIYILCLIIKVSE